MNIESYRGPGMAGGVSPALKLLMGSGSGSHKWWYLNSQDISATNNGADDAVTVCDVPNDVVEGHYRYCNEFLWPVMHELDEHVIYSPSDRVSYERLQRIFSRAVLAKGVGPTHFVHDYQLARLPQELQRRAQVRTGIFWHIPWPSVVPSRFLPPIIDLAKALLSSQVIGFHTREYALSYLNFVSQYLDGVLCNYDHLLVTREAAGMSGSYVHRLLAEPHSYRELDASEQGSETKVVVEPLGLDINHWATLSGQQPNAQLHTGFLSVPYVLSVDRADYTKGIINRLESVNRFFERHPDMMERVTFVQICVRTRIGIEAYDQYWMECEQRTTMINDKYRTAKWQPVLNIEGPLNSGQLAVLYRNASVMCVGPLRDGLNLTAKEFIACQKNQAGVLALSRYAGVWDELGDHAVEVDPYDPEQMSEAIYRALTMSAAERQFRLAKLTQALRKNTLATWCSKFESLLDEGEEDDEQGLAAIS